MKTMKKRIQCDKRDYVKRRRIESEKYPSLLPENANNDHEETHATFEISAQSTYKVSAKIYIENFNSLQNDALERMRCAIKKAKEDRNADDYKFKTLLGDFLALDDDPKYLCDAETLKNNISSFLSILTDYQLALERLIALRSSDIYKYRDEHNKETNLAKAAIAKVISNTFSQMNKTMLHKKVLKKLTKAVNLALLSIE
ncbi:hypothetical protein T552_00298 [Pneumocystis carinii B80]|uniref:Uncharacterized protein n=1 Tax=Pneumocystis carinii (strain B80) TaxID=1408658 RepID=A0A0W4ZQD6_PNEC8|nr:hypothetical protein T552_00298 [Pneumocystis carinii B80]KTW30581.1 hypothetical protein T552_00298 [Pneumocystis carinii B80]